MSATLRRSLPVAVGLEGHVVELNLAAWKKQKVDAVHEPDIRRAGTRGEPCPPLVGQSRMVWRNRDQFLAVASRMMRRILVDHARARHAAKCPPANLRLSLEEGIADAASLDCEILLLDQVLDALGARDARQAQVVEMRYFGGLSVQETARALSVSRAEQQTLDPSILDSLRSDHCGGQLDELRCASSVRILNRPLL